MCNRIKIAISIHASVASACYTTWRRRKEKRHLVRNNKTVSEMQTSDHQNHQLIISILSMILFFSPMFPLPRIMQIDPWETRMSCSLVSVIIQWLLFCKICFLELDALYTCLGFSWTTHTTQFCPFNWLCFAAWRDKNLVVIYWSKLGKKHEFVRQRCFFCALVNYLAAPQILYVLWSLVWNLTRRLQTTARTHSWNL